MLVSSHGLNFRFPYMLALLQPGLAAYISTRGVHTESNIMKLCHKQGALQSMNSSSCREHNIKAYELHNTGSLSM